MALPPFLNSIVDWVRKGYPEGLPQQDYLPLVALLGSQLSNDDVTAIADELADKGDPTTADAIREAITHVAGTQPTESDIARVRARLAAGGWPLASPHYTEPNPRH